MSIHILPYDILYLVFKRTEGDMRSSGIDSRHPLSPLVHVCKRWKSIVDQLIYVNLDVLTDHGLARLVLHLAHNSQAVDLACRTTRRLSLSGRLRMFSRDRSDEWIELVRLFPAAQFVDIPFCAPPSDLVKLINTSGAKIKDLHFAASRSTFATDSITKLRSLVRLDRLSISFVYDSRYGSGGVSSSLAAIKLPLVEAVHFEIWHWVLPYAALLTAFQFPALTALHIKCWEPFAFPPLETDINSFLQRHSSTILDGPLHFLDLVNVWPLIAPFRYLHSLEITCLQILVPRNRPPSLVDLRVWLVQIPRNIHSLPYQELMWTTHHKQFLFLDELSLQDELPSLKSIQAIPGIRFGTGRHSMTDASTPRRRASRRVR